jgi:hypothetical protein
VSLRTHRRTVIAATTAAVALLALAPAALAGWSEPGGGGTHEIPDPTGGTTTTGCKYYTWGAQPKLVIHVGEFDKGGGTSSTETLMKAEIQAAVDQFNAVGDTAAKVTKVETSTAPFSFDKYTSDGAIHVGFTSQASFDDLVADRNLPTGTDAMTATPAYGCGITEAHILFPDPNASHWTFYTPFTASWYAAGARYYDAGAEIPTGGFYWFRPSFLHELEHAFGLTHTKTQYAFMNHRGTGGFPWANRPAAESVRPLPDDARVLRARYPASGTRYDVAVLNTWYEQPADPADDAGSQTKLCQPSLGTSWSADSADGTCGKNGATTACAGDTLRTRYTLANYSTETMTVWAWLYFSKDETFDGTDPYSTTSAPSFDIGAAKSAMQEPTWTVPTLAHGVKYHPIVRVIAEHIGDNGAEAASVKADWIPLRGIVTGC